MQLITRIRYWLTLLVAAFPAVYPHLSSYTIGLWGVVSLVIIVWQVRRITIRQITWTAFMSIPFFIVLLFSLFVPSSVMDDRLGRSLTYLIFPMGFILVPQPFPAVQMKWIKRSFVLGAFLLPVSFIVQWQIGGNFNTYTELHDFYFRIRTEFNHYTMVHPGYASTYFIVAVLFLLEETKQKKNWMWTIPLIGYFLAALYFLMARLPILAGGIMLTVWFFRQSPSLISSRVKWVTLALGVILFAGLLFTKGSRWSELVTFRKADFTDQKENTLLIRKGIYQCSWKILKDKPLTGVGPEHVQEELNNCYTQYPTTVYQRQQFNTHNQYFDYGLNYGGFGILILLMLFLVPMIMAWNKMPAYSFFLLFIMLCMLGENLLSRQSGFVFYGFFNGLFFAQLLQRSASSDAFSQKNE